jgi:hypothetical protein
MPRGVNKEHLPTKVCEVCGRPFTWRRKWARCWDEVRTCSHRCQQERRRNKQQDKHLKNDEDGRMSLGVDLENVRVLLDTKATTLAAIWVPVLAALRRISSRRLVRLVV